MSEAGLYAWRNPWFRWSVLAVSGTAALAILVGFVWLPSAQGDFGAQGIWASICRAAGVPQAWGAKNTGAAPTERTTHVVLTQAMSRPGPGDAAGRGATLALQQCTMCHGARGVSRSDVPSLAGQHPEVVFKQLSDYKTGARSSSIMQAMATNLSAQDVSDLAAYYASLPRVPAASDDAVVAAPALVTHADAMRNIAACAACHGSVDRKLGAPRLEGMSKAYLAAQLTGFATGARKNDSSAQMRNMARALSPNEIDALATFYAQR